MATPSRRSIWTENILQGLAPTPGRMEGALRTAAAVTIATYLLLWLRIPQIPLGMYFIFLVSYETAYLTLQESILQLSSGCIAVAAALLLVEVTDNDPMARVLGIAFFTFVAGFFLRASTRPSAPMVFGIYAIVSLSWWERHLSAEQRVHLSMWPMAAGAVAVACKVAIEYVFTRRDPQAELQEDMDLRLEALERLFRLYAEKSPEKKIRQQLLVVSRYALAGQGKAQNLLEELRIHPAKDVSACSISPSLIPTIAQLLDLGTALGRHDMSRLSDSDRARFQRMASVIAATRTGSTEKLESLLKKTSEMETDLLGQLEETICNLGSTSEAERVLFPERLKSLSARKKDSWLRRDAWTNPTYPVYAMKLSLSATLCYVIYNALAWPGISTAVLTVLVTGLSSTGATNQKMFCRIVGAILGGLLFGLVCLVYLFPYTDTSIPFMVPMACVAFISAWIARNSHIRYVGMQVALSFFLLAFEGFSEPTGLAPARDRLIGIFLALIVMLLIFHQFHPERTVDKMRTGLARLLAIDAELISLLRANHFDEIFALREDASELVGTLRELAEVIPYEFDQKAERDLVISQRIQNAASTAYSVFLTTVTWPRTSELPDWDKTSQHAYAVLEEGLRDLSGSLQSMTMPEGLEELKAEVSQYPEPIQTTLKFYVDLQNQCKRILSGSSISGIQLRGLSARHV